QTAREGTGNLPRENLLLHPARGHRVARALAFSDRGFYPALDSRADRSLEKAMSAREKLRAWLLRNRTSVRMAFILRLRGMGLGSLLSLVWTRLLLRAMGDPLYGLFLSFQAVTRLGGLGDLGLSGGISIKTGAMLGRGE